MYRILPRKIILKIMMVSCLAFSFILTCINVWKTSNAINSPYNSKKYYDFINLKSSCSRNRSKVAFVEKHIPPNSICYFWEDPKNDNLVAIECLVSKFNYFLFPRKVRYGERMPMAFDYLLCDRFCYSGFQRYLKNLRWNNYYTEYAENENMVILKKKERKECSDDHK